jgi:hypothetical protein
MAVDMVYFLMLKKTTFQRVDLHPSSGEAGKMKDILWFAFLEVLVSVTRPRDFIMLPSEYILQLFLLHLNTEVDTDTQRMCVSLA